MLGEPRSMVPAVNSLNLAVTTLDWIIIAFTVLMAVWGYAAGPDRRRPLARRLRGGSVHRLAARPAAPRGRLALAVRPAVRAARRAADRGHVRLRSRAARLPPARAGWAIASGCSTAWAARVLVACLGLFLVWIGGAVALQTPGARELRKPIQRSAILKRAERGAAAVGRDPQGAGALRPVPVDQRARRRTCRRRTRRSRATRDVQAAGRSVVRVLGTACGLGVQGSGWVAGNGIVVTNAHVVAGQDDTTVQLGRRRAGARRRGDLVRPAQRPRDPARARARGRARAADERERRGGYLGGRARLPRERPVRRRARAPRPDRHGDHPGRLRARAGAAHDHLAARAGAARATPAARRSTAPGAWSTTIFAAATGRRRTGLRGPGLDRAGRAAAGARAGGHRPLRTLEPRQSGVAAPPTARG